MKFITAMLQEYCSSTVHCSNKKKYVSNHWRRKKISFSY